MLKGYCTLAKRYLFLYDSLTLFTSVSMLYILLISVAQAEPHPHQGILKPYLEAPKITALSPEEQEKLAGFKPIYKKWTVDRRRRGLAIFRVAASKTTIWSVIRDFDSYPLWIKDVKETEVYRRERGDIYVSFEASHWLLGKTRWYVRHQFPPANFTEAQLAMNNWGSWTLDYDHRSDFNDSVGFWQIVPVVGQPDLHDVIYSVDLSLSRSPAFIKNRVVKRGLRTATQWLREQAENRQAKHSGEE